MSKPDKHDPDLVVVAFAKNEPTAIDIFCVHVGEHGALFTRGAMVSLMLIRFRHTNDETY